MGEGARASNEADARGPMSFTRAPLHLCTPSPLPARKRPLFVRASRACFLYGIDIYMSPIWLIARPTLR